MNCTKPESELVSAERLMEILEDENRINVSVQTKKFGYLTVGERVVDDQIKPIVKDTVREFHLSYIYHSDGTRFYLFIH